MMYSNLEHDKADATLSLVRGFKLFYQNLAQLPFDDIGQLYANDIRFVDPVHEVLGVDSLRAYTESMCKNITSGRFQFVDELIGADSAYVKWNLYFTHSRLGKQVISLRGMSHIMFKDKIYYHEDCYDLGEMLYTQIPLLGMINTRIKNRLKAA